MSKRLPLQYWKTSSKRLAYAIIRFANSGAGNHTDSTINFALKIVRQYKSEET